MSEWTYYKTVMGLLASKAPQSEYPPVRDSDPQTGYYKTYVGGGNAYEGLAIWRIGAETVALIGRHKVDGIWRGFPVKPDGIPAVWLKGAKHPVSKAHYLEYVNTGHWPAAVANPATPAKPVAEAATPGIGDNSGEAHAAIEVSDLEIMATLIAEATLRFEKAPIASKADADYAEDTRQKIRARMAAVKDIHRAEKKPHLDKCDEIDAKYLPYVKRADDYSKTLDNAAQAWVKAENVRAAAKAAEEHRKALEQQRIENERIEAERKATMKVDPVAALKMPMPSEAVAMPYVPPAKVMIGTTRRRGQQGTNAKSGRLADLSAVAAELAKRNDIDFTEYVEKRIAKWAKNGDTFPGVVMSWQEKAGAAE